MFRTILLLLLPLLGHGQQLSGTITSGKEPVSYATVFLKDTRWGTTTAADGTFLLQGIAPGEYQLKITAIGYRGYEQSIKVEAGADLTLHPVLQEMPASLNEVVVTGTRTSRRQLESPVAVNRLDSHTLNITQSTTLAEGLCFQPGLRVETDCQTCNYTQLRINGLGGSYSQILINSRPVFTSLLSLYGLEQIPANMIERVEVVRGAARFCMAPAPLPAQLTSSQKSRKKAPTTWSLTPPSSAALPGTIP